MAIWRLFEGDVPYVSTFAYHKDRERAPHLEQAGHVPRLKSAAQLVRNAAMMLREVAGSQPPDLTLSDLGCGDGGLLSLVQGDVEEAWGYDFCPANAAGWIERGVTAEFMDVFGDDWERVRLGAIVVMTEVLEHVARPHEVVRWLHDAPEPRYLVASSPWDETPRAHDPCHAWAYDFEGYEELIEGGGWHVLTHEKVGRFQVMLAQK